MEDQTTDGEAVVADAVPETNEAEAPATETTEVTETDEFEGIVDLDEPLEPETAEADEETAENADDPEDAEAEDGDEEEAVEMRSFDFGGNKLEVDASQIPVELADKIDEFSKSTWSDYTRKAQANAETAKSLTAQADAVAKLSALNGDALQTYSEGLQLRSEIEQLGAIDLPALWQSDPDQARRVSDTLGSKQAAFQATLAKVGEQEQALDTAQQAELARRSDEGKASLDKRIKNFTTEHAQSVVDYVVDRGMAKSDAEQWALNPEVTEYAYKAMLYDRMQAKAAKPKPKPAKPVKPMKAAGTATNKNDPEKMSMRDLQKHLGLAS